MRTSDHAAKFDADDLVSLVPRLPTENNQQLRSARLQLARLPETRHTLLHSLQGPARPSERHAEPAGTFPQLAGYDVVRAPTISRNLFKSEGSQASGEVPRVSTGVEGVPTKLPVWILNPGYSSTTRSRHNSRSGPTGPTPPETGNNSPPLSLEPSTYGVGRFAQQWCLSRLARKACVLSMQFVVLVLNSCIAEGLELDSALTPVISSGTRLKGQLLGMDA